MYEMADSAPVEQCLSRNEPCEKSTTYASQIVVQTVQRHLGRQFELLLGLLA